GGAGGLVGVGRGRAGAGSAGWLGMAGRGFRSGLGRRVERLMRLDGRAWRPPGAVGRGVALTIIPAALLAAAVLSTAWARAQALPEGDSAMPTMNQSWKTSLAALVLTAALGPASDPAPAAEPPGGAAGKAGSGPKAGAP